VIAVVSNRWLLPGDMVRVRLTFGTGPLDIRNIIDVSEQMESLLKRLHVVAIEAMFHELIHGRSWEMAAIMGALSMPGTYSGTVEGVHGNIVKFGPIRGLKYKRELGEIKTYIDIPQVGIPPL
jgi:hypothetical protein